MHFINYVTLLTTFLSFIGFEEATKGCCGTGTIEVSFLCNSLTKTTCDDPSKFVFWDTFHPTERAYKILTDEIFENYLPYLQ